MNLIKKLSYGLATLASAAIVSVAPAAHAQVATGYSDVLGNLPGSNLGLGQLFVLDKLFAGNGGVLGSRTNGFVYTVQSGDTLKKISAEYLGNSNLYGEIVAANNIPNPNVITPGQQLVIPTGSTVYGSTNTGVLNTGGNNIGNMFLLGRLFNGGQQMNLGDYLIMNQLFNNGAYGNVGNGSILGTGVGSTGGSSLGDLFVLDQLFGGNSNSISPMYGYVPVVPVTPSTPATPAAPAPSNSGY